MVVIATAFKSATEDDLFQRMYFIIVLLDALVVMFHAGYWYFIQILWGNLLKSWTYYICDMK